MTDKSGFPPIRDRINAWESIARGPEKTPQKLERKQADTLRRVISQSGEELASHQESKANTSSPTTLWRRGTLPAEPKNTLPSSITKAIKEGGAAASISNAATNGPPPHKQTVSRTSPNVEAGPTLTDKFKEALVKFEEAHAAYNEVKIKWKMKLQEKEPSELLTGEVSKAFLEKTGALKKMDRWSLFPANFILKNRREKLEEDIRVIEEIGEIKAKVEKTGEADNIDAEDIKIAKLLEELINIRLEESKSKNFNPIRRFQRNTIASVSNDLQPLQNLKADFVKLETRISEENSRYSNAEKEFNNFLKEMSLTKLKHLNKDYQSKKFGPVDSRAAEMIKRALNEHREKKGFDDFVTLVDNCPLSKDTTKINLKIPDLGHTLKEEFIPNPDTARIARANHISLNSDGSCCVWSKSAVNIGKGASGDYYLAADYDTFSLDIVVDGPGHDPIRTREGAQRTVEKFRQSLTEAMKGRTFATADELRPVIQDALVDTELAFSKEEYEPCTLAFSLSFKTDEGQFAVVGTWGDACAFLARSDGNVTDLCPSKASDSYRQAYGGFRSGEPKESTHFSLRCYPLEKGDAIMLGSDGFRDNFEPDALKKCPADVYWELKGAKLAPDMPEGTNLENVTWNDEWIKIPETKEKVNVKPYLDFTHYVYTEHALEKVLKGKTDSRGMVDSIVKHINKITLEVNELFDLGALRSRTKQEEERLRELKSREKELPGKIDDHTVLVRRAV